MKNYGIVTKEVKEVVSFTCDVCGKTVKVCKSVLIEYGDCDYRNIDICSPKCYKEAAMTFVTESYLNNRDYSEFDLVPLDFIKELVK